MVNFKLIQNVTKEEQKKIIKEKQKNRWLSKSQVNCWKQCPKKWWFQYIVKCKQKPSDAMMRGIKIHKDLEKFYDMIEIKDGKIIDTSKVPKELHQFIKFEERRIKSCVNIDGSFNLEFFKPVMQEVFVKNETLKLRGYIDAVYKSSKDGKLIIIDWKTGKYRPEQFNSYRFELAMYKELYEKVYGDEVGYWGIYFVDADKLFFEPVKSISIKAMYKSIKKTREGIESGEYPCKPGILCRWCDFHKQCGGWS